MYPLSVHCMVWAEATVAARHTCTAPESRLSSIFKFTSPRLKAVGQVLRVRRVAHIVARCGAQLGRFCVYHSGPQPSFTEQFPGEFSMTRKSPLCAATAVLAVAVACRKTSPNPASPFAGDAARCGRGRRRFDAQIRRPRRSCRQPAARRSRYRRAHRQQSAPASTRTSRCPTASRFATPRTPWSTTRA